MTTTREQTPNPAAAEAPADPYRYGWRYIRHTSPERYGEFERIPLTRYDVLHPQEDDFIVQNSEHNQICAYLQAVFQARVAADPSAVVLQDVRLAWDVPELKPHGSDIAVIFGVRAKRKWGTFDVAEEGVRPALIVEVTSETTRSFNLDEKIDEYYLAGVPLYVIVDIHALKRGTIRRLLGYRHTIAG